jgi:2-polyprenyl-3-methyl-5-hydroxy-6-metoxy-1,4-benzoquinol methylase
MTVEGSYPPAWLSYRLPVSELEGSSMRTRSSRWNHNIHYHPVILRAVLDDCERVLDVGCGDGMLARELRRFVPRVTAIDLDEASIDLARQHEASGDIEYVMGDFLTHSFEPASFDAVVSIAALHHMDMGVALGRMRQVLRPGGTLAVVGLARSRYPVDLPLDIAAALGARIHKLTKTYWDHSAPTVWPPPETFGDTRRLGQRSLPGVRYRRHLLWRYSLTWTK